MSDRFPVSPPTPAPTDPAPKAWREEVASFLRGLAGEPRSTGGANTGGANTRRLEALQGLEPVLAGQLENRKPRLAAELALLDAYLTHTGGGD